MGRMGRMAPVASREGMKSRLAAMFQGVGAVWGARVVVARASLVAVRSQ
jgi:hypothetical protein